MDNHLVSIIIPVYKVEEYLDRCVESVINQTYTNLEIILVDDGSPDHCPQMCDDWAKKDDRIRVVHQQNKGLSGARNTGIREAKGDWLYFLDSDDEITHDCIELLVAPLRMRQFDFVMGYYEIIGNKYLPPQEVVGELLGRKNIAKAYSANKWHQMAWNKLCNREFIIDNDLYFKEGLIHEDELWSAELACTAESMYVVDKVTYLYYIRMNSIMSAENKEQRLYWLKQVIISFYEYFDKRGIWFKEVSEVENHLQDYVIWQMKEEKCSNYTIYREICKCDVRSWKLKNRAYPSFKQRILNFDKYLPSYFGYIYCKMVAKYWKAKGLLKK